MKTVFVRSSRLLYAGLSLWNANVSSFIKAALTSFGVHSMAKITLWHNPHCSKSVHALQLIRERGWEPEIFLYKSNPPSAQQIWEILELLELRPFDLIRKQEPDWVELELDPSTLEDRGLIEAMVARPSLIQRPIIICDSQGCLGRPVQNIIALLDQITETA
jgi:arsenate reductase